MLGRFGEFSYLIVSFSDLSGKNFPSLKVSVKSFSFCADPLALLLIVLRRSFELELARCMKSALVFLLDAVALAFGVVLELTTLIIYR